jgi:hypothetical protein
MRTAATLGVGAVLALVLLVSAVAASMSVTSGRLGGGTATVNRCDPDGFTFLPALDTSGRVTTVRVMSIAAACAGGTLRLTLANGTTSVGSASTTLPSSGFTGSVTVTVSPNPLSTNVTAIHAVVEGP